MIRLPLLEYYDITNTESTPPGKRAWFGKNRNKRVASVQRLVDRSIRTFFSLLVLAIIPSVGVQIQLSLNAFDNMRCICCSLVSRVEKSRFKEFKKRISHEFRGTKFHYEWKKMCLMVGFLTFIFLSKTDGHITKYWRIAYSRSLCEPRELNHKRLQRMNRSARRIQCLSLERRSSYGPACKGDMRLDQTRGFQSSFLWYRLNWILCCTTGNRRRWTKKTSALSFKIVVTSEVPQTHGYRQFNLDWASRCFNQCVPRKLTSVPWTL